MTATSKSIPPAHSTPSPAPTLEEPANQVVSTEVVETTEASAPKPEAKTSLVFPLLLTVLIVLPLALGIGAVRLKASASSSNNVAEPTEPEPVVEEKIELTDVSDRRLGDRQFLEHRYEVALQYYRTLGNPDPARLPPELLYRIALCQEGLGQWEDSLESFRMMSDMSDNPILRAASSFGQARLWFRLNEPSKAESLLRSIEFHSDVPSALPRNMLREIGFLIPLAMAQETVAEVGHIGRGGKIPLSELLTWSLEMALKWADESILPGDTVDESEGKKTENKANVITCALKRIANKPPLEGWTADLKAQGQSLKAIAKRLAMECGWNIDWTDLSQDPLLDRNVNIFAEERPVCLLLTAICSELKSTWSVDGERLTIARTDSGGEHSRQMVARALEDLSMWIPNHRLADHTRFAQAQFAQYEGSLSKAAKLFASLTGRDSSPLAIRSAFNAATNYYRLGDFPEACRQLGFVVDGAPETGLHTESLVLLGRLLLDRGETQEAVFQLRRASESRSHPHDQARAVVFLGMAYLFQDKFEDAAEIIFANKSVFEEPEVRNAAAFVTSYARWNTVAGEMKDREATFLYRALQSMKLGSEWLGQSGQLIIGRTYVELGFDDHMADLYSQMLTIGVTEFVESEMTYSLANYEFANGRIKLAKSLWEKIAASTSNRWTNLSRMKLAEVALLEGHGKIALDFCELIRVGDGISRTDIQKLMGRIYEQLGEDSLAAKYYAGQLPKE